MYTDIMKIEKLKGDVYMHFTGTIWRPPFEANSSLLQVTVGCTHDRCKFCSLYDGINFRVSPMNEIEEDLAELKRFSPCTKRIFMTGGNPVALSYKRLKDVLLKIHQYLPKVKTIGGFARVTDITSKTVEQLIELHELGLDGISIGTESGDDDVLAYMNKGYTQADIIKQCQKLEKAGINYNIVYMTGLAGSGKGEKNAIQSTIVYNQLKPESINIVGLTIFPETGLLQAIETGEYKEAGELEKLYELELFVRSLKIETTIYANTISNLAPFAGNLPTDTNKILNMLNKTISQSNENDLKNYRNSIRHL